MSSLRRYLPLVFVFAASLTAPVLAAAKPSPAPVATESPEAVCMDSLLRFKAVNDAVRNDYAKYLRALSDTDDANAAAVNSSGRMAVFGYAGAELQSIGALVGKENDAYAPVLGGVDETGNAKAIRLVRQYVQDMLMRNRNSQSWSQTRYNYFNDVSNGVYDTFLDTTARNAVTQYNSRLSADDAALFGDPHPCRP